MKIPFVLKESLKKSHIFYGIFLSLTLSVFITSLYGRTWHVPEEIPTIKEAVEDSATYGDTVLVAPGLYNISSGEVFPINMKNGVVLLSEEGPYVTTVDADGTGSVFICVDLDSSTVIEGFTIRGGYGGNGGGLLCFNSHFFLKGNIIRENIAFGTQGSGGGIYIHGGSPRIVENVIEGNEANNYCGGGIYIYSSSALVEGNIIQDNSANWGGGIFINDANPLVKNNIVRRNRAILSGGGIDCYVNSSPTVLRNVVVDNSAGTHGAGVASCYDAAPLVKFNTIAGNRATYGGGVRSFGGSHPEVVANIIVDNVDGIFLESDSYTITATDNNIYYNTYQPEDYEVVNNTPYTIDLRNNFWWFTDSSSISSLISGPANFIPFRNSPNDSAPGEPLFVTSITAMESTYTNPLNENLHIGDTLYIQLEGEDWNPSFIEPALVLIRSNRDTFGILVALIETDSASPIYRGTAYIDTITNDVENAIGVNEVDTLVIFSHLDPSVSDTVYIEPLKIKENHSLKLKFIALPNGGKIFKKGIKIDYMVSKNTEVTVKIYDPQGRFLRLLEKKRVERGIHYIYWDGRDQFRRDLRSGVYFVLIGTEGERISLKLLKVR
jgi:hypothetical protein